MAGGFTLGTENNAQFDQPFVEPMVTPAVPTLGTVDAATETVQGQMTGLLATGNPLLQRAKTKAAQSANQRGLLNSSMGVQAGEEAMLTAALPIAQADASEYRNQSLVNQQVQNQFTADSNQYGYDSALSAQDYGQKQGLAASDLDYRKQLQTQAEQAEAALSSQEAAQAQNLVDAEYAHKGTLQTQIDAANKERAQIQAETARLGTEATLTKEVMDSIYGLEESYMKDWVEINQMVFDPNDVANDTTLRNDAMAKLKTEYEGRKSIVNNIHNTAQSWNWGIA